MSLKSIKKLLHQKIGLNASSVGDSSIERAIKHRLEFHKENGFDEYYQKLLEDSKELHELIEEVVVPETWFFRNKTPFEAFQQYVTSEIMPSLNTDEKLRILSIPCSTGEEPYSIAISLMDAGIDLSLVQIDAMDISKRALTKAKRAIYGKNSFRSLEDNRIKDKYFNKGGAGYRLVEEVRGAVNFTQGNFLVGSLSQKPDYYHAIFCRNLLIYFDRDTQKSAFEKMHRSLADHGMLFVGHAESSQVLRHLFKPLYSPRSFGYIKSNGEDAGKDVRHGGVTSASTVPEQWKNVFEQISKIPLDKPAKMQSAKPKRKRYNAESKKETQPSKRLISLISVERLANQGKYQDAQDACKVYIEQNPDSAQAYYLLGLIKDSSGEAKEADVLLRKAIYLDPNHEQALVLSSLLAEKRGDYEIARAYKRRAKRVSERNVEKAV